MVNLIVSHGSQSQSGKAHNSRISSRSKVQRFQGSLMNTSTLQFPPSTTISSNEFPVKCTTRSFSINSPSVGDIGRYRSNASHFGLQSTQHEPVCDYDHNVTELYELLESSQWVAAMNRCSKFPEEVRTWIVRKDLNGKLRWRVLPLHSSIIFKAPKATIQRILSMHLVAASKQDDQGMLPLHLAFRHKVEEDVLQQLLEAYKTGIHIKDRRGRTPIDHATEASFSVRFVQLYARMASSEPVDYCISEERDEVNGAKAASTGMLYEERMKDIENHNQQKIRQLQMRASEDNRGSINPTPKEPRSMELEDEVQVLQASLERATVESRDMVQLLKQSREKEKHLEDKFQVVLNNQKALHKLCLKQQQQLEQAQNIRMQMLRSMFNTAEDRRALDVASEISQISNSLVVSTDELLSHVASKLKKEGEKGNPIALIETEGKILSRSGHNNNYWMRSATEHGDEISGITEVSQI